MRKFGSEKGRFYAQYLKKLKRCRPWRSSPWVARDPGKDHFFLSPGGVTESEQRQTKLASHTENLRTSGNLGSTSFPRRLRRQFIPKRVGRRLLAVGETANDAASSLRNWPRAPLCVPEMKDVCKARFSADGLGMLDLARLILHHHRED